MNDASAPTPASLLSLALSFYRDPLHFQDLLQGRSGLPAGVAAILLAAGAGQDQPGPAGEPAEEVRKAAAFFIEQVLFAPNADYYRLLGLNPQEATDAKLREHYRLLMRLFHPDRRVSHDDWQAVYAGRVNQAYHVLRRPQSRREYDDWRAATPNITQAPWRPPFRPAKRPPARAAARWRQHLPQYVLTGMALAAGLFVLQVYLSQGQRVTQPVNPPAPVTPPPATAETAAPEPRAADRLQPLLNELAQALPTGAAETEPSRPPPPPVVQALPGSAARAPVSSQAPPLAPADKVATVDAVVKGETVTADRRSLPPPPPVITDPTPSLKQEATLAERRDSSPSTPAVDPAVTPAPASPDPVPARVQVTPARAENAAQHVVAGQDHQPPRPVPVAKEKLREADGAAMSKADRNPPSPPRELPKKAEDMTARIPAAPTLKPQPADNPSPPRPRPEERVAKAAEHRAPVASTAASPLVSPPQPPAPGARPAPSARPKPPPISPAESASLLGRFIAAYNQGDLGTMRALFGPGNPALNQYRDLFSRTAARQLAVSNFNWRFTPSGALGRGGLSLQLRHRGAIPDQSYTGSLELELGRQEGGRLYIKRVNHVLRSGAVPATPRTPAQGYGGNG